MEEENIAPLLNKIVFTSLGPDKKYTAKDGREYADGDVGEFEEEDYVSIMMSNYARNWDLELETSTKRLVASAEKTRARILAKVANKLKK